MKKTFLILSAFLVFISLSSFAQANVPENFGADYNLSITSNLKNVSISQSRALRSLVLIFPDYDWPEGLNTNLADSACQIDFLNCDDYLPLDPLTQATFLQWWSYVNMPEVDFENDKQRMRTTWYSLRSQGWLPILEGELTHGDLQTILYRYQTSQAHAGLPYRLGMALDSNEITTQFYLSIPEVDEALEGIGRAIKQAQSADEQEVLQKLEITEEKLTSVRQEIYEAKHPFNVVTHEMPEDIKQKITEHGLNEVLGQVTYNHSADSVNRRYNLLQGLKEINGVIYQPGEMVDYYDVLKANGLNDYRISQILSGGGVAWAPGGGLCGSASSVFRVALDVGLFRPGEEGSVRYNHSSLYSRMYPEDPTGKDATIYFGAKNLTFINHFDSPILFYTYNDLATNEVTLYIFGNQIYKDVYVSDAVKTGHNRYEVEQVVTLLDGTKESRILKSYYPGGIISSH